MLKNTIPLEAQPDTRKTGLVQLVKFALVGGTGTGVHYLVLITLVALLHISAGYAAGVGAIAGACVNYVLNRRFTFGSHRPHRETLPRFALMAAVGAVLNGLLVGVLVTAHMHFLLAQAIATLVILILNFIVSKLWIFR
jgi:putative flippase GtrA